MHIYDAVVPPFARQLMAMVDLVEIARKACNDGGAVESELVGARIHPAMLPFAYQIKSTAEHSMGSIISVRRGTASPNLDRPPDSLDGLTRKLDAALEGLAKVTPDEMQSLKDREIRFEFKTKRLLFSAQDYFVSYAIPNFYFHATTAYDILRMRGLPIGKLDFLGRLPATPF